MPGAAAASFDAAQERSLPERVAGGWGRLAASRLHDVASLTFRAGVLVSLLLADPAAAAARPNIVLILSDNQSAASMASYGNRDVRTPHIDRLSQRGVRFTHAYAASGMCSPTRATLLTGLMPSQHGLHNALSDEWVDRLEPGWSAVAEFRTVPATLAQHGYQTAMIGKWHVGDPKRASSGFEHWVALAYGHTRDFWNNRLVENGEPVEVEGRHIVDVLAEKAAAYLAGVDRSRPFFLQLGLDGPYALAPTNSGPARNRHYARYVGRRFESMPREPVADQVLSRLSGPYRPDQDLFEIRDLDAVWDHLLYGSIRMQGDPASYANFLSQNAMVDDAVGKVMAAIEAHGLEDDTVVIYTADQGNLFGQHGHWGHTIWFVPSHLYEEALHVPLIVVDPRGRKGATSDRLVGQYDVAPTILELAGVRGVAFESSPGSSFAGEVRGRARDGPGPQAVFFEQEESRGIRTARFAYWKRVDGEPAPVLFDMEADPGQRTDLHDVMKGSAEVEKLDDALEAFFARYSVPEHDLWNGGIAKGTSPRMFFWLERNGWPWVRKLWQDFVTTPPEKPPFGADTARDRDLPAQVAPDQHR
jgi:arylsulfatase A-like enzyme